jgi:hypothetical protein
MPVTDWGLLHLIAALCIGIGLIWLWRGDRVLAVKRGFILRVVSPASSGWARYIKWPMGAALIVAGVLILLS